MLTHCSAKKGDVCLVYGIEVSRFSPGYTRAEDNIERQTSKSPNISLGGNQQRWRVHAAQRARHYPSCCLYKEPLGLYEKGEIRPHLHAVRLFLATRARSTSPSTTPTFSPRPVASQRPDIVFLREFLKPRRRKPPVGRDGIHVLLHG